jgi:hypothetical protein
MPAARNPRVNVVVSHEQHALLYELARLDPDTRSASAFLRQLLDEVTPLLRKTVPMMKAAAEELDSSREGLRGPLRDFLREIQQMDLLEHPAPGANRTERSEGGRTRRRPRQPPRSNSQGQ